MRLSELLNFQLPPLPDEWRYIAVALFVLFVSFVLYVNYQAGIKWTVLLGLEESDWERRNGGDQENYDVWR